MEEKKINILVIGAGKYGKELICRFKSSNIVNIVGIADKDKNAPGMMLAKELDMPHSEDYKVFFDGRKIDQVINTIEDKVPDSDIMSIKSHETVILSGDASRVLKAFIDESEITCDVLRKSESKYEQLYNSSQDAIMVLDPETFRFTAGNPSAVKIFRCENEDDFIRKTPVDLSPEYQPDGMLSMEKATSHIRAAMENGTDFFEWKHKRSDGEEFFASVLLTRMGNNGNTMLQATVRDITEQKQIEQRILKINDMLIKIGVDYYQNIDLIVGTAGDLLEADSALYNKMDEGSFCPLGKWNVSGEINMEGRLEGRVCYDVLTQGKKGVPFIVKDLPSTSYYETDPNMVKFGVKTYMGGPIFLHNRCVGSICLLYTKNRDFSESDKLTISIISDVLAGEEERLHVMKALTKSEERYRTLVENLNIGVYRDTGTPRGEFIQANMALAEILGYDSVREFKEMSFMDFHSDPEDRENFIREIEGTGGVKDKELRLRKRDGTPIIVSCTAKVQYTESHNIDWIDGVIEDVTERKRAEAEISQQRKQLDLVNKDLQWKIDELEAAFTHIKRLEGLVPICASCKKMLKEDSDPKNNRSWIPFEEYISERTDASFTHGLCPECIKRMYGEATKKKKK